MNYSPRNLINKTYINIPDYPSRFKEDKEVPYARTNSQYIWTSELVKPTIEFISVPPALRNKGYGSQLIDLSVMWALKCGFTELWFDNFAAELWAAASRKYRIIYPLRDKVGYIKLDDLPVYVLKEIK